MRTHLINGNIYVNEGEFVEALAIEDGVIVAAGTSADIGETADETFDLDGRTVLPGFNDSHMHLMSVGSTMSICDLTSARSVEDVVRLGRAFLEEHPDTQVLYGRGWNQDYFTEGEVKHLHRNDADRIATDIPVILTRVCGHLLTTNTHALDALGITEETTVEGGEIERDADGSANGRFNESAIYLAYTLLPEKSVEDRENDLLRGADYALSVGITSVQSADPSHEEAPDIYRALHNLFRENRMPLRYSVQQNYQTIDGLRNYLATEFTNTEDYDERWFRRGALKLFKDGSLGARTSEMLEEFADDPGNIGVEAMTREQLRELVATATAAGLRCVTHAIGDGAVEAVMDAYLESNDASNPLRHGIVHCQITRDNQLERIIENNIAVMYQPIFLDYDLQILEDRVGPEVAATSYAFGSMIRGGAHVSFGSDAPVEDCNPFPGIYCAVTRQRMNGTPEGGFAPQHRCSVSESVDAYTTGSAWNEGTESFKGRLMPGHVADLIVLDRDIFTVNPDAIAATQVLRTMVDGEWVYAR